MSETKVEEINSQAQAEPRNQSDPQENKSSDIKPSEDGQNAQPVTDASTNSGMLKIAEKNTADPTQPQVELSPIKNSPENEKENLLSPLTHNSNTQNQSSRKKVVSIMDIQKGLCSHKLINSPRTLQAIKTCGFKLSDLEVVTKDQIMKNEPEKLLKLKTSQDKQFYIQSKLQRFESLRLKIIEEIISERENIILSNQQSKENSISYQTLNENSKPSTDHKPSSISRFSNTRSVMGSQYLKYMSNQDKLKQPSVLDSLYAGQSRMAEKEQHFLEKYKERKNYELEIMLKNEQQIQEMRVRELKRQEQLKMKQLEKIEGQEQESQMKLQKMELIDQRRKEYLQRQEENNQKLLEKMKEQDEILEQRKRLKNLELEQEKKTKELQRLEKLDECKQKKEIFEHQKVQSTEQKLQEIEKRAQRAKSLIEDEKLRKKQEIENQLNQAKDKLAQIKLEEEELQSQKFQKIMEKEKKVQDMKLKFEEMRTIQLDQRRNQEKQKITERQKYLEEKELELEKRRQEYDVRFQSLEQERLLQEEKIKQFREERQRLDIMKRQRQRSNLEKIEEEEAGKYDEILTRKEDIMKRAEERRNEYKQIMKQKLIEEQIKQDLILKNHDRMEEIKNTRNQLILKKIEEDSQRVKMIEDYKLSSVKEKQQLRTKFLQEKHKIDQQFQFEQFNLKKKIQFSHEKLSTESQSPSLFDKNALLSKQVVSENAKNPNLQPQSRKATTPKQEKQHKSKANRKINQTFIQHSKADSEVDLDQDLFSIENMVSIKYYTEYRQNLQNNITALIDHMKALEPQIEQDSKTKLKDVVAMIEKADQNLTMIQKRYNHLKLFLF